MSDPQWAEEVAREVDESAGATSQYYLLSALSCVLATLGLITNSVAVIIGAMLVAPLLSPIMAFSLATVRDRPGLYRRSILGLGTGACLAVGLSTVIALGATNLPFDALSTIPSEVAVRAEPSLFDLGVALAGGAAGAYAVARLKGAAAVIGVAIATALMPPLCVIGIGLALGDAGIARGAFLLFLTNFVAISFSAMAVFAALGLSSRGFGWRSAKGAMGVAGVVLLSGMLFALTLRTAEDARQEGRVRRSVTAALAQVLPGSELLSLSRETSGQTLRLRVRVQVPDTATAEQARRIQEAIADDLGQRVELSFVGVPTLVLDVVEPVGTRATSTPTPRPTATATPSATPTPSPTPTVPSPTPTVPSPTPPGTGTGSAGY
ncbi:MAG: DUF389 domain-containing protein [Chloroflexi bacterium]|nr:DUF389 domain-containing protein [Chloroflexota bacterium]